MDGKKFVGSWLVGAVVMFVLAGLWHMVIMSGFYAKHAYFPAREETGVSSFVRRRCQESRPPFTGSYVSWG